MILAVPTNKLSQSFLENGVDLLVGVAELEASLVCLDVDVINEFVLALQLLVEALSQAFEARQAKGHLVCNEAHK